MENISIKRVVHCMYNPETGITTKKELKGEEFNDWIERNKANQTILKEIDDDNTNH